MMSKYTPSKKIQNSCKLPKQGKQPDSNNISELNMSFKNVWQRDKIDR